MPDWAQDALAQRHDPAWRPFRGGIGFAPHPAARLLPTEPKRAAAYAPLAKPPPAPAALPPHPLFARAAARSGPTRPRPAVAPRLATLYRAAPAAKQLRSLRQRLARPLAMTACGAGLVGFALAASALPSILSPPRPIGAVFTAPMHMLRAAGPGEVASVAVAPGEPVGPSTVLLTLRADLPHGAPPPGDHTVVAGVRGIVWSLDTPAGGRTRAGGLLAQIADCGRAFLVLAQARPALSPGTPVMIRMAGLPPFHGTIRLSSGAAEPPDQLVIDPTGFTAVAPNACPVGSPAEIQPEPPL